MPAIARLLYYGGIQLCGPPVPHAATHRHCSALLPGGRPFQRIRPHPQRVTDPLLPGSPHRITDIRGRPCRFCAVAAGLPAPLTGSPCRAEGGASSGAQDPRSRQPAPPPTSNPATNLIYLTHPSNEESPRKRLNLKLIFKETRAGSSAWKSARLATERSRVQVPAGPPPSLPNSFTYRSLNFPM